MKKLFCLLCCLVLVGCGVQAAPPPPVLRFESTPVTLTQGARVLQGALTFSGVDNVQLAVENPQPLQGFVFTLARGEVHITRGDVTVTGEKNGCAGEFLQAVRDFDLGEAEFANGTWQLVGEEIFLTTDENGTPLRLWSGNWQADFG